MACSCLEEEEDLLSCLTLIKRTRGRRRWPELEEEEEEEEEEEPCRALRARGGGGTCRASRAREEELEGPDSGQEYLETCILLLTCILRVTFSRVP
jgi:hypothetical protein